MGNEENIDGAGVEVWFQGPENLQPQVLDAIVVEPASVVEFTPIVESAPVVEPAPVANVARGANAASAPDPYAVGVRLIKMSPVWLLTVAGGFALLLFLLSWVRPVGDAASAAPIPNDAKSVPTQTRPSPAAKPVEVTPAPVAAAAKEEHVEVASEAHAAGPVQAANATPAAPQPAPAEEHKQPANAEIHASDASGKFTVQVASFSVESQANERISSLRAAGFDARSTAVELPGRGKWLRVHVGRFAEREEAAKVAAQLRAKGAAESSMVVPVQE